MTSSITTADAAGEGDSTVEEAVRAPIPTEEERLAARQVKREAKLERRAGRGVAAEGAGETREGNVRPEAGRRRRRASVGEEKVNSRLSDVD